MIDIYYVSSYSVNTISFGNRCPNIPLADTTLALNAYLSLIEMGFFVRMPLLD